MTVKISTLALALISGEHGSFRVAGWTGDTYSWETLVGSEPALVTFGDDVPAVEVPETEWSDYGSDLARSNYRSILRDLPGIVEERGYPYGYSSAKLVVPLWVETDGLDEASAHIDPDAARDLAEHFVSLRDEYPLWDEMDHSDLQAELIEESWDSWLGWDVTRIVNSHVENVDERVLGSEWTDGALRDAFWSAYSAMCEQEGLYPEFESATSVILPEWESVARDLAERIRTGAIVPSVAA